MKTNLYKRMMPCLLALITYSATGQDINFSQFYDIPLLRNPALAGLFKGDIRITSAFRSQWQSVTTPYRTIALGFEYKRPVGRADDFVTYGFQATSDMAGDSKLSRTQVFPVFNYHKSLNGDKDAYLSAGIMGGPVMEKFDPGKLTFDDQYVNGAYSTVNPTREQFNKTNLTYWDIAAGLSYSGSISNTKFYLGGGIYHFTKPKVAFQKQNDIVLNEKYVVNAGFSSPVGNGNQVIVYGDYFMQGGARQGQGGLFYSYNLNENEENEKVNISAGIFYRWKDALMPVIRLDYYKMSIGVTYDVNTSKLKTASQLRGGYEITLSYRTFSRRSNSSADKVRCPQFY